MGLCCCKIKETKYSIINGNNVQSNNNTGKSIINKNDPSLISYRKKILEAINSIVNELLGDKAYVAKPVQTRQVSPLQEDEILEDLDMNNFIFADEVMSQLDLEDFLNSCSPSTDIPEEPSSPTVTETEQMLIEGKHIALSSSADRFQELKMLMESAMRLRILHNYIDMEDSYGNTSVSVSLLNSNSKALIYLVSKCFARIPLFITVENNAHLFLIYLAQNHNLTVGSQNQRQFILHMIMKEFSVVNYDEGSLRDYFTAIDPVYQLSLLHFLVELCLTGQSPTQETMECIQMCINLWPSSLFIHCQINRQTNFRIDVVGRILCFANIHNVDVCMKLIRYIQSVLPDAIIQGRDVYMRIIAAYEDTQEIHSKLKSLFE